MQLLPSHVPHATPSLTCATCNSVPHMCHMQLRPSHVPHATLSLTCATCNSVPHMCHMPGQSHPPLFSYPTNFWAVLLLIMTLLITPLSSLLLLPPLSTSHPLSSQFFNTLNLRSPRNTEVRSSQTTTKESRTDRSHIAAVKPQSVHSHSVRTAVLLRPQRSSFWRTA